MGLRIRRLVAAFGILAFLAFYIWAATVIGEHVPANPLAQLAYYALVGTLWGVPLFPLLSWAEGKPFLRKRGG
ncbi:MAG: DUF2842 domain-containing protein [Caulobacteraceae bacterium]|nr:DUF2842 domain-containing protein [Caulobacteraceae bacterium]